MEKSEMCRFREWTKSLLALVACLVACGAVAKDLTWTRSCQTARCAWTTTSPRLRKVFGRDYGALDMKGWRVVAGNSQYWYKTEAKDEQAKYEAWVKAELEEAKSRNGRVILATHIPPFAFASDEKDSYDNYLLAGRAARLETYAACGARFFLTAHLHRLAVCGYKDVTMLGVEAVCANIDARPPGFRLLEINDDFSYSWNFIAV